MKSSALVFLGALALLGAGFYAGAQVTASDQGPERSIRPELQVSMERMARALEHLEARLGTSTPTLAAKSDGAAADSGQSRITEMLESISQRLDGLSRERGTHFTSEETSHDRSEEQDEKLHSLEGSEPEGVRREHYMWTGRDLLERYGRPDRASHWTGMTIRWVYVLDREAASTSPRVVFELVDGYVTAAFVERRE